MSTKRFVFFSFMLLACPLYLLSQGCAAREEGREQARAEATQAPVLGGADGMDTADTTCRVVLRRAFRPAAPGGYETLCVDGRCWFVWEAEVDVAEAALAAGATTHVMYQSGSDPTWWAVAPEPGALEGAPAGFARLRYRFYEHTVSPGMSLTSLVQTRIQLIPYLRGPGGGRVFDHNRIANPLDNYLLSHANAWTVEPDHSVCPGSASEGAPISTLRFLAGWQERQHGAVVAGGTLRVEYNPARLTTCRASYTYAPAWGIEAHVRFWPGGELVTGSVVAFESGPYGEVLDRPHPGTLELTVPANATRAEIWFRNWSGMSSPCEAFDSRFGENYIFEVIRPAEAPAAVPWAGDWGNGLSRECQHRAGLANPVSLDSYLIERACLDLYADVYVPGLTDGPEGRERWLIAQVVYRLDNGDEHREWLEHAGRQGNNARVRWTLPRQELASSSWSILEYAFLFSTDGVTWHRIAEDMGPHGGADRRILRAF